ncbi:HK97-gp10 family putative phage morphogenesis protein [Martelella radicis]|uniref:HK97 gp10 family phage protein n=1 Tax=Martelella radicis TaxID=1397476 RepID=A0A7W6KL28_9HYPH|nr:HK97-gp10 family putative phage morphogenesis protein [Martelella radicis]MBB4123288.1 HK97 gp10 family phage protein [Martelella radicis]
MANDGGISRLKRRLNAIPKDVREAIVPDLMKSGNELASTMKSLAPEDSGDLKSSIAVTGPGQQTPPYSQPGGASMVPENAVAVTVGNEDVRYPHLVEYGTKAAPAQPFFWPAYRLLKKRITSRTKRTISKAVRKRWGK